MTLRFRKQQSVLRLKPQSAEYSQYELLQCQYCKQDWHWLIVYWISACSLLDNKLPGRDPSVTGLVMDPMLATGGSAVDAIRALQP